MPAKRKSSDDDVDTTTGSPPKRLRITKQQKQALVDNLQLEIAERARKLRAQYALQASDLRARIERRVNRVPVALRKAKMGELLQKHSAEQIQKQGRAMSKKLAPAKGARGVTTSPDTHRQSPAQSRRAKKPSHEGVYSDKENAPASEHADSLNNPKRRANGPAGSPSRVAPQKVTGADSRILSPKSLNSRTYPHSPLRSSPDKLQNPLSPPGSPLKASSPLRGAPASSADKPRARPAKGAASGTKDNRPPSQRKGTTSRAGNTGGRAVQSPAPRSATRQKERRLSTSTNSSTASVGTTVVKPTPPATATGARKPTASSTTKKTSVARNQAPVAARKGPASGAKAPPASDAPRQRTLRKRI